MSKAHKPTEKVRAALANAMSRQRLLVAQPDRKVPTGPKVISHKEACARTIEWLRSEGKLAE